MHGFETFQFTMYIEIKKKEKEIVFGSHFPITQMKHFFSKNIENVGNK